MRVEFSILFEQNSQLSVVSHCAFLNKGKKHLCDFRIIMHVSSWNWSLNILPLSTKIMNIIKWQHLSTTLFTYLPLRNKCVQTSLSNVFIKVFRPETLLKRSQVVQGSIATFLMRSVLDLSPDEVYNVLFIMYSLQMDWSHEAQHSTAEHLIFW